MWEQIKHAFAVKPEGDCPPTAEQLELVDRLCGAIQSRRLTPAAAAFLELSRPLSFLGAQGMHFFEPIATAIFSKDEYRRLATFLERHDAIDVIMDRLEPSHSSTTQPDPLRSTQQAAAPAQHPPDEPETPSPTIR